MGGMLQTPNKHTQATCFFCGALYMQSWSPINAPFGQPFINVPLKTQFAFIN